jgi:hypothetical protein
LKPQPSRWVAALLPGGFGLAGLFIVLVMTLPKGIGLSPDSVAYISTAENLVGGRGLIDESLRPLISWPPFYPLLIALFHYFGVGVRTAASLVNAIFFGLLIALSAWWLLRRLRSTWLALAGTGAIMLSFATLRVADFAWSETVFTTLLVGCLILLDQFVASPRVSTFIGAAVCAALGALTRYAGVLVIMGGALVLLTAGAAPLQRRVRRAVVFAVIAIVPLGLLLVRNFVKYSTFAGRRSSAKLPITKLLARLATVAGEWFLPARVPAVIVGAAGLLILTWLALVLVRTNSPRPPHFVPLLMGLAYLGLMLIVAALVQFQPLNNRLLAPGLAPLALALFAIASSASGRDRSVAVVVGLVLVARSLLFGVQFVPATAAGGPAFGYNSEHWKSSQLALWVLEYKPPWPIFSNHPQVLYAIDHLNARFAPLRGGPESLAKFRASAARGEVILIWFKEEFLPTVSLNVLKKEFELKTLTTQKDGTAYLVKPLKK